MLKFRYFIITASILILTSCGFKIVNYSSLSNFEIAEITTSGERKINYRVKNKLLQNSNKDSDKLILIKIETERDKSIKEKNIKNEITKYALDILIKVEFSEINNSISRSFTVKKNGDYAVSEKYTQTLNNEKKLNNLLADDLADIIFKELVLRVNDL